MPRIVNNDLLIEFHEQIPYCEHCDKRTAALHVHHIIARGMGGGQRLDIPWNLIVLCADCHAEAHKRNIDKKYLLGIASERELWRMLRGDEWRTCSTN